VADKYIVHVTTLFLVMHMHALKQTSVNKQTKQITHQ